MMKMETYKVVMNNEKNGFYESDEFFGNLEECKNYLLEEKKIIEEQGFDEIEIFEDKVLTGYGGYGHFTYKIEKVENTLQDKIKEIGTKKGSQIFLTTVQLNQLLGSKMVSIGRFGVFITLENGK